MKRTALIMAGGRGERFWPKSRTNLPKQFLSLTDDGKTMIQLTVERILPIINMEDIYIATNEKYKALVQTQLPLLPAENILCEPVGRNTAPCIGLGAVYMQKKYEDATMMVLPSDHLIKNEEMFTDTLVKASDIARSGDNLVTLGITPNYPETGYGYIKYNSSIPFKHGYRVEKFVEKPNLELAQDYLSSGDYLWNSGMFIWNVSVILKQMKHFIPDTYENLMQIQDSIGTSEETSTLKDCFSKCKSESIDYAIMEHSPDIYTIPGNFGWDDVGSWLALERHKTSDSKQNIKTGNIITLDTTNCIIEGNNRLIAAVGLDNLIIVDTDDSLLICSKDKCNQIKELIGQISKSSPTLL